MTKKNIGLTYEIFLKKIKSYIKDKEQLKLIDKAYNYASEKHFGIKRLTGEDYIVHPLNVAYILTEISADSATICAALLHDILEDCDVTKEELAEDFTLEIASLVDGVTKINKLNFESSNSAMIATHRKILVGLCEDVRVIIIKLADRLHNMRTLWVHSEKKQKEISKETLDILTPIAHRLGMNQIKSELEDLSLRYLKPDVYFSIVEQLNQTKSERDSVVLEMLNKVSEMLNEYNINHSIKGRAKSIYSIYRKLDKGRKFSDIYDLLALRVFVDTEQECYQALGIIHSKYRPIPKRFKDFIAMPKTNMYQSLHTTVFGLDGYLFEIQIRTYQMDEIAELGIASHWSYKEGGKSLLQNTMEQKLQFFRSIIELNNEEANDEEFVKSVTEDVFKDTIYVFTPKGDVIELPNGANPIDFAYRVHSGVGEKMVGAIVNNNIVPFDYKLKDNDIIKIITNKNSIGPSREWINMAHTTQAKNKIKAFYNKLDKEEYFKKGEEILSKYLRKKKIPIQEFLETENVNKILEEFKCGDLKELYINIGTGKYNIGSIANFIYNDTETKEQIILKKTKNKEVTLPIIKKDIIVEGIDEIKINIASCCKPVPNDRIVGYITKGKGITVHRMVCPNVSDLEERIISVRWNEKTNRRYPTNILITATDSKNILLKIISKTANSDITVESINTLHTSANHMYEITVLVDNKEKLTKFMNDISSIKNIVDVKRIIK
ncbi:MAG TPA: bifunctional (p)ppGpp synthetase/guanosine-3',5'-bis(diphosphate) 3'-pyrophosphohydrolase [Tenericutes bacterium]|nr:bifunctional (p)ppGpp synthetase/guanosine-3',5'-bis(diphosphate) 3'-pyrophosphohydrolase [Mycoplasmatota bacterium]